MIDDMLQLSEPRILLEAPFVLIIKPTIIFRNKRLNCSALTTPPTDFVCDTKAINLCLKEVLDVKHSSNSSPHAGWTPEITPKTQILGGFQNNDPRYGPG